jgi:hypothetical protein
MMWTLPKSSWSTNTKWQNFPGSLGLWRAKVHVHARECMRVSASLIPMLDFLSRKIMEEKDSAIALCNAAARTSHECDRELREMLKQVDEVQQESRTAKEEAENLRSELQAKSAQDRANISSLQGQVDRLSELLAEAKLKDDEKSNVVSSLTGEIQKLQRELGKKSEQTVKLQIELSETGRLLEILEGKAGLQANRLTEMQVVQNTQDFNSTRAVLAY